MQFDLSLELLDWSFLPDNSWNANATLVRTDTDGLQSLFGSSYPVHGLLSGDYHVRGTRANPELNALFDVIAPEAWGWKFDRARGQLNLRHGEVRISNTELRRCRRHRQMVKVPRHLAFLLVISLTAQLTKK